MMMKCFGCLEGAFRVFDSIKDEKGSANKRILVLFDDLNDVISFLATITDSKEENLKKNSEYIGQSNYRLKWFQTNVELFVRYRGGMTDVNFDARVFINIKPEQIQGSSDYYVTFNKTMSHEIMNTKNNDNGIDVSLEKLRSLIKEIDNQSITNIQALNEVFNDHQNEIALISIFCLK